VKNKTTDKLAKLEKQLSTTDDFDQHQRILRRMQEELDSFKMNANDEFVRKHGLPQPSRKRIEKEVEEWGLGAVFDALYDVIEEAIKDPELVDDGLYALMFVADSERKEQLQKLAKKTKGGKKYDDVDLELDLDEDDALPPKKRGRKPKKR
jgi:hypothetical protein